MIIIPGRKKNLSRRYYANLLDYFIFLVVAGVYIYLAGEQDNSGTYRVQGFKAFLVPVGWLIYFPLMECLYGRTIGKKAFHLCVVNLKGKLPTMGQAFLRRMLDMVEIPFFGTPALLAINYSDKNQRMGDIVAGTTVVRTDAVCRHCGAELELAPIEVIRNSFTCPGCLQENFNQSA